MSQYLKVKNALATAFNHSLALLEKLTDVVRAMCL